MGSGIQPDRMTFQNDGVRVEECRICVKMAMVGARCARTIGYVRPQHRLGV